jgi:hypothetical protein
MHLHMIPRFRVRGSAAPRLRGDMDDPRGGLRYVVPSKGNYLRQVSPLGPRSSRRGGSHAADRGTLLS